MSFTNLPLCVLTIYFNNIIISLNLSPASKLSKSNFKNNKVKTFTYLWRAFCFVECFYPFKRRVFVYCLLHVFLFTVDMYAMSGSPSLTRSLSPPNIHIDMETGSKYYHLVSKNTDKYCHLVSKILTCTTT